MHVEQWLLILILVIPLALVVTNRLRMDLAALLMAAILGMLQFSGLAMLGPAHTPQDASKAISGFSQSVVITLISLFIISRGLEKSGVMRWMARHIVRIGGNRPSRFIALFTAVTAFLSLFMNNLAAGALVLPSAMEVSRKTGIKPSKLLIPVAYGSLLGGTATYFTTANIIMSDLLLIASPPQAPLRILDFTPTGGLITIAGIIFFGLFGNRLLPYREPGFASRPRAHRTGDQLEDLYHIGERLWLARLEPASKVAGKSLAESEIGKKWGITVAAIQRGSERLIIPDPCAPIHAGDQLLIIGRQEKIDQLNDLRMTVSPVEQRNYLSTHGLTLAEVILSPHSTLAEKTLKDLELRRQYGITAVALKRLNRSYRTDIGDIPLAFGDSLLVLGPVEQLRSLQNKLEVLVLEPLPGEPPVNVREAALTIGITFAAIAASIAGAPVFLSMLIGAVLMLLLNLITPEEAYRTVEWQAIFLIAGMYAVSLAMVQTGLAALLGQSMLALVTPLGALGVAGGAYLLTALLTQFMGGQVSALVTGPVVISAALAIGANPQAVAVATAIGCSASFFTPMAHPVNILMIAPAHYRFSDFFRAGWLLTILCFIMLLVGLKIFWGL